MGYFESSPSVHLSPSPEKEVEKQDETGNTTGHLPMRDKVRFQEEKQEDGFGKILKKKNMNIISLSF